MAQTDWFAQYKLTSAQQKYVATVQVLFLVKENFERIMMRLLKWSIVCYVQTCLKPERCCETDKVSNSVPALLRGKKVKLDSLHMQNAKISSENIQRRTSKNGSHPTRGVTSSLRKSAMPSTGKRMREQIHEFKLLYAEVII